jgi:anti-sigma factor RsiW
MTSDEARALFDAALDDELAGEARAAFAAALARDEVLRGEFARHEELLAATRMLGHGVAPVDLLSGVQQKLRARSGGRFYRDRFSQRRAGAGWLLVGCALVVVLTALWLVHDAGWL